MGEPDHGEITELLLAWSGGEASALDKVMPLVYAELKKLAAAHLRRENGPVALETTALVHEAFLRMAGGRHPAYENRSHFYGIASRLMRQILVEMARARTTEKRFALEEPLRTDHPDIGLQSDRTLLAIDDALIGKLKNGKTATLGIFQTPEQGVGMQAPLAGFKEAYEQLP